MEHRCAHRVKIATILFDLGDTLIRLHPMPEMAPLLAAVLGESRSIPAHDALPLAAQLVANLGRQVAANSKSGVTDEPGLEALMAPLFEGSPAELAALGRAFGQADISRFEMVATGVARIERLKSLGLRLGVVSNTNTAPAMLDDYLRTAGLLSLFDAVVYSVARGIRKPHPQLYRTALKELGSDAETTLFVGDRVREDVLGPRAAGMRAVLTHEFRQEDVAGSAPLAVVSRLEDLQDLLPS